LATRISFTWCIAEHFACVTNGVDPHAYTIRNTQSDAAADVVAIIVAAAAAAAVQSPSF
jgi:hypothetical protein